MKGPYFGSSVNWLPIRNDVPVSLKRYDLKGNTTQFSHPIILGTREG